MTATQPSASQPDGLADPALVDAVAAALWVSLLGRYRRGGFDECPPQHVPWWRDQATAAISAVRAHLAQTAPEQPDAVAALDEAIRRLVMRDPMSGHDAARVVELLRAELTTTPPAAQVAERQDEA